MRTFQVLMQIERNKTERELLSLFLLALERILSPFLVLY